MLKIDHLRAHVTGKDALKRLTPHVGVGEVHDDMDSNGASKRPLDISLVGTLR